MTEAVTVGAGAPAADRDFSAAVAAIRELAPAGRVLLICHVNPDGDALGSMLGFALGLRRLGVQQAAGHVPGRVRGPRAVRRAARHRPAGARGAGVGRPGPGDRVRRGRRVAARRPGRPAAPGAGLDRAGPPRVEHRLRHRPAGRPARRGHLGGGRAAARPAGRAAGPGDRRVPVRGAGHRHRLVQVRHDHAAGARDGGPADRHRDPARARSPAGSSTAGRSAR